jgi:hypothetical protein
VIKHLGEENVEKNFAKIKKIEWGDAILQCI